MWPLYVFVLCDYLTWIWCLCVVSSINPFANTSLDYLFENKIQSTGGFILFAFIWGYMGGVSGLAGHELIHRKEPINKFLGMMTYTKMLYSHFLLEHSNGHHRFVATPDDCASARINEPFYSFMFRSAIGGHLNTWKREVSRIRLEHETF